MPKRSAPPAARRSSPLYPIVVAAASLRDSQSTLDQVRQIAQIRADAESALTRLVIQARAEGHAWSEIGGAAGTSPQGAQQRAERNRS